MPLAWGYLSVDIVVAAVVADVVQSGSGVDKHRYHGLVVKNKCAPGSNTTKDDKNDRKGIYEYHPGGVNDSITPGV